MANQYHPSQWKYCPDCGISIRYHQMPGLGPDQSYMSTAYLEWDEEKNEPLMRDGTLQEHSVSWCRKKQEGEPHGESSSTF